MTQEFSNDKKQRLLDTAFSLFSDKGIKNTSIQEIVDKANVAKGTFYLYFKDKYELQDILITTKSEKLFNDAFDVIPGHLQFIYKHFLQGRLNTLRKNRRKLIYIAHYFFLVAAHYHLNY